ncbi:MAG: PilZ domain-containing protein [Leptospiraceae bacterium]|nr:PilZ domain-containing protein [Leptospiraceae bacterium]MCP5502107.1 PilZ domain-containing protein [Leptospiraceae bacterium]
MKDHSNKDKNRFSGRYVVFEKGKQRRKYSRIRLEVDCEIYTQRSSKPTFGTMVDIGAGGIRFETGSPFYEGDEINVSFFWGDRHFEIRGLVIRVSGKYVAIKTDDTPIEIKEEIERRIFEFFNRSGALGNL